MAEIRKITGLLGAEIVGIDLGAELSTVEQEFIRSALNDYHVIVFRYQRITQADQKKLTSLFGQTGRLPYVMPTAEDPEVIAVLKESEEVKTGVFGGEWHSDFSFLENPPAGSVLHAVEIPPVGGDTLWANQVAAYETLSNDLKELIEGRNAIHVGKPYGVQFAPPLSTQANGAIKMRRGDPKADREISHPASIILPESQRRALFLNPTYTTRLEGMSVEESKPYLEAIYKHCTRPDFSIRWRWQKGDVVVWNNRATLHYATNDYDGFRRLLYRTTYMTSPPLQVSWGTG